MFVLLILSLHYALVHGFQLFNEAFKDLHGMESRALPYQCHSRSVHVTVQAIIQSSAAHSLHAYAQKQRYKISAACFGAGYKAVSVGVVRNMRFTGDVKHDIVHTEY